MHPVAEAEGEALAHAHLDPELVRDRRVAGACLDQQLVNELSRCRHLVLKIDAAGHDRIPLGRIAYPVDHLARGILDQLLRLQTAIADAQRACQLGRVVVDELVAEACGNRSLIVASAEAVKAGGAKVLRGGAYKPRTSPYAFQGLGLEGLKLLKEVGDSLDILTITEAMSPEDVPLVAAHADILQIGARNMQNYPLLIAAGKSGHPTMLKRGPSASVDEFLLAAEYLLHHGSKNVLLCERGVHPLDRTYTRNTLDLNVVPVLKSISHLPVIVDPSHGVGVTKYVPALAKAAIAAGADGLILEVHPCPKEALSDGAQSLTPEQFLELTGQLRRVAKAVDRGMEE